MDNVSNHLVSVILPIYNQADHVQAIVDSYEAALSRMPSSFELLLVVNNSRDHSLEVCQQLAERHKAVRVLHTDKGGWGLAVKLGLAEAHGEWLCYTNSARTTAEDLLLMMLYAIANPHSVIKANRKVRESWRRRFGSLLYNLECRALFDLAYWDINGTPKVFPRQFSHLLELKRDDDMIDLEFNVICSRHNYPVLEVPILSARRHGGKSTTNYRSAARMYLGAYRLWQHYHEKGEA